MKKYIGHTDESAKESREKNGSNKLHRGKKKSFFLRLLSNFKDPIVRILIAALAVNIIFTLKNMNITECIGIVIAILTSTLISTLSEYGSENAFEKLVEKSSQHKCRVYRNGSPCEILSDDIVVGDIVILNYGEMVPADGILLEGMLSVDQSVLNGESREAKKKALKKESKVELEAENRVFRGSIVTQGSAVIRVTEVGDSTFLGAVAKGLQEDTRESPLKIRLASLAKTISIIGYILAAVVAFSYLFTTVLVDNSFDKALILAEFSNPKAIASLLIKAITLAITIVVVAVPEGLPMMICVVLSSNMKKMLNDSILVKKLVGIETAGSLNILFCDKTGTITTGVQSVEGFVLHDGRFIKEKSRLSSEKVYQLLCDNAFYNTDCTFIEGKAVGSNATDRAIAEYFSLMGEKKHITAKIPFDSRYKYSAVRLDDGRVIVKGAPELILKNTVRAIDESGSIVNFNPSAVLSECSRLTSSSSRVIAVAISDEMPTSLGIGELTFVALISIKDVIRQSAKPSIKTLSSAGIQVVMVTGDAKETARAIAAEAGIISSERSVVITSEELSRLTDSELAKMLPNLAVVARALPQDKTRLVKAAQELEFVVGMTGDGVNDAPALKLADVGFAMGSGTDIAKEAGDIVILDNDISAITKAVLYGRTIFKSIRKFIVFQLTMNFCAVGVTLIGPFIGVDTPITIIQMLWVNIIMDTLGGLAFAGESPTSDTMTEPPKRRGEPLLNAEMFGKILWNGIMTVLVSVAFMSLERVRVFLNFYSDPIYFYSAFFSLFIFLGIMNFFSARSERINLLAGLRKNRAFLFILILISVVQLIMVYFGGTAFRTTPLDPYVLLGVLSLSFVVIPLDTIRRVIMHGIPSKNKNFVNKRESRVKTKNKNTRSI